MSKPAKIKVLGAFEAFGPDGKAVRIGSKKAQALLAYLAIEHSRPHSRESLATLLWARTGEERARHNLRQALSHIRAACDCLLLVQREHVEFNQADCMADVIQFEQLTHHDDRDSLEQCLALYRGELLEGLYPTESAYSDWLTRTRLRLQQDACEAAGKLGALLIEEDEHPQAMAVHSRILELDPAHEGAHQNLMRLLNRQGRRSEALRQYQACADAMQRELGTQPGEETRLLAERLRETPAEAQERTVPKPGSPPSDHRPALAIMPFENLSGPDDAFFTDGMAEDLVTALSRFQSLVVIARGSSFRFRDSELSDQEIANRLKADYLVRGSVRRSGERVRISVQLLSAENNVNVWGQRYDRQASDVFALQDEITAVLVSTLVGRVEAAELREARRSPPERLDAHELLLRGRDHHHQYTEDDCRACIDMFRRATERDPSYALAHAWLACGLGQAMVFELDDLDKLLEQAQQAAERGLALDPDDSECHRVLAQIHLDHGDLDRAMHHQERALRLNPNDDRVLNAMGEILVYDGQYEAAEDWILRSMQLNPYHPQRYWTHLARAQYHQGKFAQALESLEQIDHLRKDDFCYLLACLQQMGESSRSQEKWGEMQQKFAGFMPADLVASLPLQETEDREALRQLLHDIRPA